MFYECYYFMLLLTICFTSVIIRMICFYYFRLFCIFLELIIHVLIHNPSDKLEQTPYIMSIICLNFQNQMNSSRDQKDLKSKSNSLTLFRFKFVCRQTVITTISCTLTKYDIPWDNLIKIKNSIFNVSYLFIYLFIYVFYYILFYCDAITDV